MEQSFWRYKQSVMLDDQTVYDNYHFGRKQLKALEALPLEEILQKMKDLFSGWQENTKTGRIKKAGVLTAWSRQSIGRIHTFGSLNMARKQSSRESTRY